MDISIGEVLTVIGLVFSAIGFCINKALKLTKDLVVLTEKYESLNEAYEASRFSLGERIDDIEEGVKLKISEIKQEINPMKNKITELDKEMSINSVKLDTVITGISKLEATVGKIFDIMEKKQDKSA